MTLYTIGHSTRTIDELIEALKAHDIQILVDIRAFPMSRRLPHFNRESLEKTLPVAGIEYRWLPALGGHRKKIRNDSPVRRTCAPSAYISAAIACWYQIGWSLMVTKCFTLMAQGRSKPIN